MKKFLIVLLATSVLACKHKHHTYQFSEVELKVHKLVDSAMQLSSEIRGKISDAKFKQLNLDRIVLLNQALRIDSTDLAANSLKMSYEFDLMQWDSVISNGKKAFKRDPYSADIPLKIGQSFELKGDTATAHDYYQKALSLINRRPVPLEDGLYNRLSKEQKARTLILLRRDAEGRAIYKELSNSTSLDKRERDMYKRDLSKQRCGFVQSLVP